MPFAKIKKLVETPMWHNLKYLLFGIAFGIVLIKSEVISWFRIQEMFRLQSFHMFGVIGSAVAVGAISVFLIKKFKIKSIRGEEIILPEKTFNNRTDLWRIAFWLRLGNDRCLSWPHVCTVGLWSNSNICNHFDGHCWYLGLWPNQRKTSCINQADLFYLNS